MPGFTRSLPLALTAALMAGLAGWPGLAMDLDAGLTLPLETGPPDLEGAGRTAGALQSRLAFDADTLELAGRLPWRLGGGSAAETAGTLTELQAGRGGRIVVGVLQARQADAAGAQNWLSYAGLENDLRLGGGSLRLRNDLAFYRDGAAEKGARPGGPLDALGYRLSLADSGGGPFTYGLDFRFHGADFEAEGAEVDSDSAVLGLSSGWRFDGGLKLRAELEHSRSELSSDNPKSGWDGKLAFDQDLQSLGLSGWDLGLQFGALRETEQDGDGEDRLSASLNLAMPLGGGWQGAVALRSARERRHDDGETEDLQALDLRAARDLSLLGLSGRLSSKAFVELEREDAGRSGTQGLDLKLVLAEDGRRLELDGGLAYLRASAGDDEEGLESHLRARFAQEHEGISFGVDAEGTRDVEEGAEISGGVFVEFAF